METRLKNIERQNEEILKEIKALAVKSAKTETQIRFLSLGLGGVIVLIMDVIKKKLGI